MSLEIISEAMGIIKNSSGIEAAHSDADQLLIETIECLVEELPQYKELIDKILISYDGVDKWYS